MWLSTYCAPPAPSGRYTTVRLSWSVVPVNVIESVPRRPPAVPLNTIEGGDDFTHVTPAVAASAKGPVMSPAMVIPGVERVGVVATVTGPEDGETLLVDGVEGAAVIADVADESAVVWAIEVVAGDADVATVVVVDASFDDEPQPVAASATIATAIHDANLEFLTGNLLQIASNSTRGVIDAPPRCSATSRCR